MVVVRLSPHWKELTGEQKAKVNRYIETLLAQQQPLPLIEKPNREVMEQRIIGSKSYQLEKVRCGKFHCGCMKGGKKHGPYWYAYWREEGKVKSKYIGKKLEASYVTDKQDD